MIRLQIEVGEEKLKVTFAYSSFFLFYSLYRINPRSWERSLEKYNRVGKRLINLTAVNLKVQLSKIIEPNRNEVN